MSSIEVEVRGMIPEGSYAELKNTLLQNGTYKERKSRVLIDYSECLPQGEIRGRELDVRLRSTNGVPEIVAKVGTWGGKEYRKELSVIAEQGSFETLVQIFALLGLNTGVLCVRNSEVVMYKDIEFSLVEVPGHSYYFEAECLVTDGAEVERVHDEIVTVCHQLGLQPFTQEEFLVYLEVLNSGVNEKFVFSEYEKGQFKERFGI